MKHRVGVAGASGYVGGELLRLLIAHPALEVGTVAGYSSAGSTIDAYHPHLVSLAGTKITELRPDAFAADDVVILALPHGESARLAAELPHDTLVLDCGADFRLQRADEWLTFYGGEHAGTWPYGLPELSTARRSLHGATRVAVPGCYPTATTLAIWPALAAGLAKPDVVVIAASGTSGAGRVLKSNLLGSEVMGAMSAYGVGGVHRHVPEIRQALGSVTGGAVSVSFTPTLAPMPRGILATVVAPVSGVADALTVRAEYEHVYGGEPFVHVLPEGVWPSTAATHGSNVAHVQVTVDEAAQKVVAVCAIDNLTKGTAGQALQCLNIMLGLPESTGLPVSGLAP